MNNLIKNLELYRMIAENIVNEAAMYTCMKLMRGIESALKGHDIYHAEIWFKNLVTAYNKELPNDEITISITRLGIFNQILRISKLRGSDVPNIPHTRKDFLAAGSSRKHQTPAITDKQLVMNWNNCTGSINLKKATNVSAKTEQAFKSIYETEPEAFKVYVLEADEENLIAKRREDVADEELDNVIAAMYVKPFYGTVNIPFERADGENSIARIGEYVSLTDGSVCVRVE